MSGGRATRLGTTLLALYPEGWRERYGQEMRGLLEDDPPRARGLASLLLGAADAHLRPRRCWQTGSAPADAMRRSVGALFACWMLVAVAGSCFAKQTEHMAALEHAHPLMIAARDMITIGAFVGAAATAVGGLPLLWQALRRAARSRDARLTLLLLSPALAAALCVALAALLLHVGPARHGGFPAPFVLEVLVPVTLAALGCAAVGALAPKAVMRLSQPRRVLLGLASWSGQALAVAILLVAGGLLLYVPVLWSVPGAGAAASGPFGASTRLMLCLALAGAALACGPALLAAARARRAALSRG